VSLEWGYGDDDDPFGKPSTWGYGDDNVPQSFPHGDMETTTSKTKVKLSPISHSTWGYGKLKYSAPA